MRNLLSIISLLICVSAAQAQLPGPPAHAPFTPGITANAAKNYCDTVALRAPEGIYVWPEKGAVVLIRRCDEVSSRPNYSSPLDVPDAYSITAIETSDILIPPGTTLGYLYPSADAKSYHLYIYGKADESGLSVPRRMAAEFNPMQQTFNFKERKTSVTFNPLALIPRMRSFLRINTNNPIKEIPGGLRRIYPVPNPTPNNPALPYPRYF